MDANQLEEIRRIQNIDHRALVSAEQFAAGGDRTLIYGYDVDRNTFHVYLKDGMLHRFVYRPSVQPRWPFAHVALHSMHGVDMVPNKRIYWEFSDFEAIRTLARLNISMSFIGSGATPEDITERTPWAGAVYDHERHIPVPSHE